MSQPVEQHRAEAEKLPPVRAAVLTISDTRTPETDTSGTMTRDLLEQAGHTVIQYHIIPDDVDQIRARTETLAESEDIDAILTNGGTGISPRDGTIEALSPLIEKEIPGFGEFFRNLSRDEVGTAAMLSRAFAGLHGRTLIFVMPGSPNAVSVAVKKLILPELAHLVYEMHK